MFLYGKSRYGTKVKYMQEVNLNEGYHKIIQVQFQEMRYDFVKVICCIS